MDVRRTASRFLLPLLVVAAAVVVHLLDWPPIGSALVATTPDGGADYTEVAPDELPDVLLEVFGIDVADDADLLVATASR